MTLLIATALLFLLSMLGLALGVILSGRCLQGSCGGRGAVGPDGTPLSCDTCPNRHREKAVRPDQDHGDAGRHDSAGRPISIAAGDSTGRSRPGA